MAHTCFIFASSLRVWSSFLKSFLFPTRMIGTFGQKCFTSGVHFSGMFSEKKLNTLEEIPALRQGFMLKTLTHYGRRQGISPQPCRKKVALLKEPPPKQTQSVAKGKAEYNSSPIFSVLVSMLTVSLLHLPHPTTAESNTVLLLQLKKKKVTQQNRRRSPPKPQIHSQKHPCRPASERQITTKEELFRKDQTCLYTPDFVDSSSDKYCHHSFSSFLQSSAANALLPNCSQVVRMNYQEGNSQHKHIQGANQAY